MAKRLLQITIEDPGCSIYPGLPFQAGNVTCQILAVTKVTTCEVCEGKVPHTHDITAMNATRSLCPECVRDFERMFCQFRVER